MNKIDLVIDMQIDSFRFLNFNSTSQKLITLLLSNKSITKQKSLTSTHILKRSFTFVTSQFSLKSFSFSSMNIVMIEAATYRMLSKWSNIKIFAVIILKINRLITTVENKSEEVNLHELSHAEALKQVKIKLFSEYHDYLLRSCLETNQSACVTRMFDL